MKKNTTVTIRLSEEQANRLSDHLEDFIFSGMADIAEAVNYQIDYHKFKLEIDDCDNYIPSFLNPNS